MSEIDKKIKVCKNVIQWAIALVVAFLIVSIIQQLIFIPVGISGPSMEPTIRDAGDTAYVQKEGYTIEYYDIIVFFRPLNEEAYDMENPANEKITVSEFFNNFLHLNNSTTTESPATEDGNFMCVIKRVIGLPGDTIEIKDAVLYRNGEAVDDFDMIEKEDQDDPVGVYDRAEFTVPEGEYFVLGDNRNYSYDSEDYGCIEADWILGKAVMIISKGGKFGIQLV